jgi:hypothetical protein
MYFPRSIFLSSATLFSNKRFKYPSQYTMPADPLSNYPDRLKPDQSTGTIKGLVVEWRSNGLAQIKEMAIKDILLNESTIKACTEHHAVQVALQINKVPDNPDRDPNMPRQEPANKIIIVYVLYT